VSFACDITGTAYTLVNDKTQKARETFPIHARDVYLRGSRRGRIITIIIIIIRRVTSFRRISIKTKAFETFPFVSARRYLVYIRARPVDNIPIYVRVSARTWSIFNTRILRAGESRLNSNILKDASLFYVWRYPEDGEWRAAALSIIVHELSFDTNP